MAVMENLRAAAIVTYFSSLTLTLNVLQVASMPFYPFDSDSVTRFNSMLATIVWTQMIDLFQNDGGKIQYTSPANAPDPIPEGENAIVISNHLSFTDFYLILSFARKKRMLSHTKYIFSSLC